MDAWPFTIYVSFTRFGSYLNFPFYPSDLSIEQVASLASHNMLPEPSLDLDALPQTTSTLASSPTSYRRDSGPTVPSRSPAPPYTSDDPWATTRFPSSGPEGTSVTNGAPSNLSGTGLPKDWWKRQERINVNILGQQGFILARYTVYEISSDVSWTKSHYLPISSLSLCQSSAEVFPCA